MIRQVARQRRPEQAPWWAGCGATRTEARERWKGAAHGQAVHRDRICYEREVFHQMRTRARVVVVIGFALLLLWLIWFTVSGFGAGLRGSGGIGEPTVVATATP